MRMLTAALLLITQGWKQPRCRSASDNEPAVAHLYRIRKSAAGVTHRHSNADEPQKQAVVCQTPDAKTQCGESFNDVLELAKLICDDRN